MTTAVARPLASYGMRTIGATTGGALPVRNPYQRLPDLIDLELPVLHVDDGEVEISTGRSGERADGRLVLLKPLDDLVQRLPLLRARESG